MADDSVELLAGFAVNQSNANIELLGLFNSRHESSGNLLGGTVAQHSGSQELLGEFSVQHSSSSVLLGELTARYKASQDLLSYFAARHSSSRQLLSTFTIRHETSIDLSNGFLSRLKSSTDLRCRLAVRPVYPFWTNRRYINGVVDEKEDMIGDANLELVIEGVMDDIKVWCAKEGLSYASWEDIDAVPLAIKRATTYGVVAALFARRTKTFRSRVIPSVSPVTVTVAGEEKEAMDHWKDKSVEMLEAYLSTEGADRIWVSTADLEPIFQPDVDIPAGQGKRDTMPYNEWIENYAYPEDVEE